MISNQSITEDFRNIWSKPDNALAQIIVINLIVFCVFILLRVLMELGGMGRAYDGLLQYLMLPSDLSSFFYRPWTLVTHFFLHLKFFHILFNMLFLYWFGKIIQEYLGSRHIISLYVLGGLSGGTLYLLMFNMIPYYQDPSSSEVVPHLLLGASAGVFAIVVGAAVYLPNFTFYLLLIGSVRIKYIALFYVILSFSQIIGPNAGGELAHMGGAITGLFYITQLRKGNSMGYWIIDFLHYMKRLFSTPDEGKVSVKPRSKSSPRSRSKPAAAGQEEIDRILDKISESGYKNLTTEEKEKLASASRRFDVPR